MHLSLDGCFDRLAGPHTSRLSAVMPSLLLCAGPQNWCDSAVQQVLTSGTLGFSQGDCWFSIPQAGSAWGAVLLDAHEHPTSHLPSLFSRSPVNWNFSFLGKLNSIWRPLREPPLLQSKRSHFLVSESASYFYKQYLATLDGWKAWQRSKPHVRYEQRAHFTSVKSSQHCNRAGSYIHNLFITDARRWKTSLRASITNITILPNLLSKQLRPIKKHLSETSVNLKLFFH